MWACGPGLGGETEESRFQVGGERVDHSLALALGTLPFQTSIFSEDKLLHRIISVIK